MSRFLIRNTLYDRGDIPSTDYTVQFSPDIICMQNAVMSYSQAKNTYDQRIARPLRRYVNNHIYVRARNNTGTAQRGWVRLYYRALKDLYKPSVWIPVKTDFGTISSTLMQPGVEFPKAGAIALSYPGFVLSVAADPIEPYVLLARTRIREDEEDEPEHVPPYWVDDAALWRYLRANPETGITDISVTWLLDDPSMEDT